MAMNNKLTLYPWMPLILVAIMVLSSVSLLNENTTELSNENLVENTDARQSPEDQLVAECEGITFEDMFVYTHALFDITINDDWKSADVWGIGWVNGSEAAEVRKDIDELMSQIPGNDATNPLTPSAQGNDGKYSTDERDALEDIGSSCVEKTTVRFGLNDVLHREDGEWNNMSWVGDTLLLSDQEIGCVLGQGGDPQGCEITSVEEEDPTYEDGCDGKGDSDCQWVDISSQRDFVLWVHGTTTFDKIDYNSFTLAVNSTNISSASLKITMPTTPQPIRLGDTQSNLNCGGEWEDDEGIIYTSDCQSTTIYDKATNSKMVNGGNNFQFETEFSYNFDLWPATQHDFFDFTTAEPEDNNPPEWTDDAPADGTKIPFVNKVSEGEQIIFTAEQISSWYYDDYSAAQINCISTTNSGILPIDSEGNLILDDPSISGIMCELIDGSGQKSANRYFDLPGLSLSITETEVNDQSLEFDVGTSVEGFKYTLSLIQDGESFGTSAEMEADSFEQKVMVDPDSSLKPGSVMVRVTFSGDNVLAKSYDVDLGLTVPSTPPVVQITDYNWLDQDEDGIVDTYVLSGQFSDPDGEEVTLSITMNGGSAGTIEQNGAAWTSTGIPFYNYDAGDYTIVIEACDSSGACVTVEKIVPNLYWAEDTSPTVDPTVITEPVGEESMPAPGIAITLAGIAVALFASRKRQD